jgi:tRNA/tmRNA/rRNA uracil-C5-methylase (TrmA/RlmC/RlmD family)
VTSSTPPGTTHTGAVDGFTHGGEGVVRVDGKAVFVAGALPGERVELRITEDQDRWARATVTTVLEPSPDRVEPPCPVAATCGGCDLQHASPEAQVRLKTRVVREQLQRLGRFEDPPVRAGRAVGPALGYRAHARLHAAPDGRLGFHAAGTNDVVPIDECPVLTPAANALLARVGTTTGAVEVELRADGIDADGDPAAGVVVLTPGPGALDVPDGDHDLLLRQPDDVDGGATGTVAMRGDGILDVDVAGLTFALPTSGFFQVSTHAAEALVAEVLRAAGDVDGRLVWDLYAGVGLLALPLARAGAEVLAVEGNPAAVAAARVNAEENQLVVTVEEGDVHEALHDRAREGVLDLPDVVVLDPPRTGVGAGPLRDLAALAPPRVVLVACDPASLARDARALAGEGYRLDEVQPLDLFPMTHHVEAVATFTR